MEFRDKNSSMATRANKSFHLCFLVLEVRHFSQNFPHFVGFHALCVDSSFLKNLSHPLGRAITENHSLGFAIPDGITQYSLSSTGLDVHTIYVQGIIGKRCVATALVEQKNKAVCFLRILDLRDGDTFVNLLEELVAVPITFVFSPKFEHTPCLLPQPWMGIFSPLIFLIT